MSASVETLLATQPSLRISRMESELLLANILKKERAFIIAHPEYRVPSSLAKKFLLSVSERENRKPIALILGQKEFFGRNFRVNRHTLIPRPETELLVENALEILARSSAKPRPGISPQRILFVDVGTGSGNIVATVAKELDANRSVDQASISLIGTDISEPALRVARKNIRDIGSSRSIRCFHSDLLQKIPEKYFQGIDQCIITANLPYLSEKQYQEAPEDVRNYEPRTALESGEDGLSHIRRLLVDFSKIRERLRPQSANSHILLEIDPGQCKSISDISKKLFPSARIEFMKDLAGKLRAAHISVRRSA